MRKKRHHGWCRDFDIRTIGTQSEGTCKILDKKKMQKQSKRVMVQDKA